MDRKLFTFIETRWFTKRVTELFSDDEYARLQWRLIQLPDVGDVIPGGNGIRKFRFSTKGKGTRGGARVIYYFAVSSDQIFMLDVYAKNEQSDITSQRLRELMSLVEDLSSDEF